MWFIAHQRGHAPLLGSRPSWTQKISENTRAQHTGLRDNKAVKIKDAFPRLFSIFISTMGKYYTVPFKLTRQAQLTQVSGVNSRVTKLKHNSKQRVNGCFTKTLARQRKL